MKIKKQSQAIREELMASRTLYCCYCLEPKRAKFACCQENHFVTFSDLYPEDQDAMIQDQITDNEWSGR